MSKGTPLNIHKSTGLSSLEEISLQVDDALSDRSDDSSDELAVFKEASGLLQLITERGHK